MKRNATLEVGKTYTNRNGIKYTCTRQDDIDAYVLVSEGGYRCVAHVITMYDDGTIEWDYSTGGYFVK